MSLTNNILMFYLVAFSYYQKQTFNSFKVDGRSASWKIYAFIDQCRILSDVIIPVQGHKLGWVERNSHIFDERMSTLGRQVNDEREPMWNV